MFQRKIKTLALSAALATVLFAPAAFADGEKLVATVNGEKIFMSDIEEARTQLPPMYQQMPMEVLKGLLVNSLADRKLVAAQARMAGIDKKAEFKERMARIEEQVLQREFLSAEVEKQATEAKLREVYDENIKQHEAVDELHARHILVETEAQAQEIIKLLDGGADFATIAKERSTGPSKAQGGDLGFFRVEQMVPEFSTAAFSLKDGEYSKTPVKTSFGWHVIKAEERRKSAPPAFDDVSEEIRNQLAEQIITSYIDGLRTKAKIVVFDENGKPMENKPASAN